MSKMIGGNLEISMMNKELALEKIARGEHVAKETVQYEKPGKMILAQGSEILHHVTPVESTQERYQFKSNALFKKCVDQYRKHNKYLFLNTCFFISEFL